MKLFSHGLAVAFELHQLREQAILVMLNILLLQYCSSLKKDFYKMTILFGPVTDAILAFDGIHLKLYATAKPLRISQV